MASSMVPTSSALIDWVALLMAMACLTIIQASSDMLVDIARVLTDQRTRNCVAMSSDICI